jgi:hypothetical protein
MPVPDLHKFFNIPYIYFYITKLCRQQAKIIQNHGNVNARNIVQGEPQHRKFKRLKLGGGQVYDLSNCLDCCCSVSYKYTNNVYLLPTAIGPMPGGSVT